jgi:hypothetical protein
LGEKEIFPMSTEASSAAAFNAAYWAHQAPDVRALKDVADPSERAQRAASLAMQGLQIDVPIMAWGFDPYLTMKMRRDYGFTWVPTATQPRVTIAPGLSAPGATPYDPDHPIPGSIKVSLDLADYPPFDPPAPVTPAPTPNASPVGDQSIGNIYRAQSWDTSPDGAQFADARGRFVKHKIATPFGFQVYWEKIA